MPDPRLNSDPALSVIEDSAESTRANACYSKNAASFDAYFISWSYLQSGQFYMKIRAKQ